MVLVTCFAKTSYHRRNLVKATVLILQEKKTANWPEPKNFNESQMWAEATSWTEGPNKAATTDIFSNTDQMGPVLFSSKTCLMSRSCSMACARDWIPLLPNTHWQHKAFDELTRKTSFSKLAEIKYTWSLPSILMTSRWWPEDGNWARLRKKGRRAEEQRKWFFVFVLRSGLVTVGVFLLTATTKRKTEKTKAAQ